MICRRVEVQIRFENISRIIFTLFRDVIAFHDIIELLIEEMPFFLHIHLIHLFVERCIRIICLQDLIDTAFAEFIPIIRIHLNVETPILVFAVPVFIRKILQDISLDLIMCHHTKTSPE